MNDEGRIFMAGFNVGFGLAVTLGALVILFSGCGAVYETTPNREYARDGQAAASDLVWRELYGMETAPPVIHWIDGVRCTSITDHLVLGINLTGLDGKVFCAAGFELNGEVTLLRQADSIADAGLDHEFLHAYFEASGILQGDPTHSRPEWKAIPWIRQRLKDAGF